MGLRWLLFWLSSPPDTDPERMAYIDWNTFLDAVSAILAVWVVVAIVAAAIGYALTVRSRRITHPQDYFRSYSPLWWPPMLAVLPAVIMVWQYVAEFKHRFPSTPVSPLTGALEVGAWSWLLAWLTARLMTMLPGITPRKFRYRPLNWFIRGPRAQAGSGR